MDRSIHISCGSFSRIYPAGTLAGDVLRDLPDGGGAVALALDGAVVDVHTPLRGGGEARPVAAGSPQALDVLRHTAAHVMAHAIVRLFGAGAVELAIGPVIEEGFYYDVDLPHALTPGDLPSIEAEMHRIVDEDLPLARLEVAERAEAIAILEAAGPARFKREIVEGLEEGAVVSLYRQGEMTDLCRGPHLASTGRLGHAFKLLSVAGAYWRGDGSREMLQRVYGTAFASGEELQAFLAMREEARRRDHRVLGRELELYAFPEESPGACIWLPAGMVVYRELERLMQEKLRARGYLEVRTPVLLDASVWARTGHLDHYRESMFFVERAGEPERQLGLKPMSCPGSALVYRSSLRSYRELPLRLAEFGMVHRNERSGVLSGMTRVRAFTQDDAHVYVAPEQLQDEILDQVALVQEVYRILGFSEVRMDLATRPASSAGSDETWREAEQALAGALQASGAASGVDPGEGVFYGPKIDFKVKDSIGRLWQLATIQVDFSLPEVFDLEYVAADGSRRRPVLLHRAILGSFERMTGILVEHHAGAFPLWLAPEQARVLPVSDARHEAPCLSAVAALAAAGLRASADLRPAKLGARIREAALRKVPYLLVIGDREAAASEVSVRTREGKDLGAMTLAAVVERLAREARERCGVPA